MVDCAVLAVWGKLRMAVSVLGTVGLLRGDLSGLALFVVRLWAA